KPGRRAAPSNQLVRTAGSRIRPHHSDANSGTADSVCPEGYLVSEESEKSNENLLGDLSDFLRRLRFEGAGSERADAGHVRASAAGPDQPVAHRRLHGPHGGGRQRPAPV